MVGAVSKTDTFERSKRTGDFAHHKEGHLGWGIFHPNRCVDSWFKSGALKPILMHEMKSMRVFVGRQGSSRGWSATQATILPSGSAAPFSSNDLANRGTVPSPAQADNTVVCSSCSLHRRERKSKNKTSSPDKNVRNTICSEPARWAACRSPKCLPRC